MRRKVRAAAKRKVAAARTFVWRIVGPAYHRIVQIVRRNT